MFSIDPSTGAVNRLFSTSIFVNDLSSCPPSASFNRPPELSLIGDKNVTEGETLELFINALDADGDGMTFSVRDLPLGASFDTQTQTFSWTPQALDAGDHNIEFVVTDNGLPARSDTEQITVSVTTSALLESTTISGEINISDASIANQTFSTANFGGSDVDMAVGSTANNISSRILLKWDLTTWMLPR